MQIGHSLGVNNTKVRGQATIPMAIKNILKKYNATLLLPGASGNLVQTFQPGNYVESTGQTLAPVDSAVGLAVDAAGSVGVDIKPTSGYWQPEAGALITSLSPTAMSFNASPAADCYAGVFVGPAVGEIYRITFTVTGLTSGGVAPVIGWSSVKQYVTANGTYSQNCLVAGNTALYIYCTSGSTTATVTIGEVRKVAGIHATQATTQYKPSVRRGLVNLLTYSNDFSNAAWAVAGTATKSGSTLNLPSVNDVVFNTATFAAGAFTLAVEVSGSGTASLWAYNGTEFAQGIKQVTLGDRQVFVTTVSPTATGNTFRLGRRTGDTATSLTFHAAALFQGTLTAQQIIDAGGIPVTTSAPASSTRGSNYWQFDGTDDRLQLSQVPFQMSDDHFVVVGSTINSLATTRILFSQRNTGNTTPIVCQIFTSASGRVECYWRNAENTVTAVPNTGNGSIVANQPFVATAHKISTTVGVRLDASAWYTAEAAAVGTFNINNATIGASAENGSAPMAGLIHAVIIGKGAITDNELLTLERFVAKLQGRTL